MRYEVILGEPEVKAIPPKKPLSPKNSVSVQDIEDKLKAAEERRQVNEPHTTKKKFKIIIFIATRVE